MPKEYFICVDGVLVKEFKILLLKRDVEPFKGFWHVPSGQVEEDETPKQALMREFKEETNLDVNVGKIIGYRIEETSDRIKIIVIFEVKSAQGEIKLNSENTEYGWFRKFPANCVVDYGQFLQKE